MRRAFFRGRYVWPVVTLLIGLVLGGLWPQTPLHTASTDSSETFAIATGSLDGSMEAVYFLDFLTGNLTAAVLARQPGSFGAIYQCNVMNDLGVDPSKNPKFLMVTGIADLSRGTTGQVQPSTSVVYVAEITTGKLAAYGIPWNRTAWTAGRPQMDALRLVGAMPLRAGAVGEVGGAAGRPAGGL